MRITWSRLLVNPKTLVLSRQGNVTHLRVEGLVCDTVCAARTRQALEVLPGVTRVDIDYEAGVASIVGAPHDAATYERAVASAVAARTLRGAIERIARASRRLPAKGVAPQ